MVQRKNNPIQNMRKISIRQNFSKFVNKQITKFPISHLLRNLKKETILPKVLAYYWVKKNYFLMLQIKPHLQKTQQKIKHQKDQKNSNFLKSINTEVFPVVSNRRNLTSLNITQNLLSYSAPHLPTLLVVILDQE